MAVEFPLLKDIIVLLSSSIVVVLVLNKLKLPSIIGLLITGIIIGPYGLKLIDAVHEVELLSEIGIVLLLFVIGMEFSLKQLYSIGKTVFIGGLVQVGLTVLLTFALGYWMGFSLEASVFLGFLFSLSSTAIVLNILQSNNAISSPHGKNALGILIFQDIIVVPMMLVTPILAGQGGELGLELLALLLKSILVVAGTYISARFIAPKILFVIARTKNKELFLMFTIAMCFVISYLTSQAGLSLALGAFLAGLIISESDYSHQATSTILPFREFFSSFFYVSIGMLMDVSFFMDHALVIVFVAILVFIFKAGIALVATKVLKYNIRTALLTGFTLFQIGEFAFILSKVGIQYGILTPVANQYFLSISILTMLFTPFIINNSGKMSSWFIKFFYKDKTLAKRLEEGAEPIAEAERNNHLIIIGYGMNGKNLALAAKKTGIDYVILEINAETVKKERENGEPILYGDAVHEHILDTVSLEKARVVVIAISDPQASKAILVKIRALSASVFVLVRTRYVAEIEPLLALGADEVIPEEFETSIEIFSRVLNNYLIPIDEIEQITDSIRSDNYSIFNKIEPLSANNLQRFTPNLKLVCVPFRNANSSFLEKSIAELEIRKKFYISIIAIYRNGELITHITSKECLKVDDLIYVSGEKHNITAFKLHLV
ncbi:MAG: cation:proton antiporter [Bacteroidota bacterium]|nr:cation:proton antiporter [Bacteroidota bacterium]